MIIVPTTPSTKLAASIGKRLGAKVSPKTVRRFPDGEMYIRIEEDLKGQDVCVVGNTRTDENILEMMLTMDAAREASPRRLIAVVPYFGYSRQHRIYKPGEPVSSRVLTRAISDNADKIYAVDVHDEETLSFSPKPFENIMILKSVGKHFSGHGIDYVVSPDDGGADRASAIGEILGVQSFHLEKVRLDDRTVRMEVPDINLKGKKILLVDDIISTGGTIMRSAAIMKEKGASKVYMSAVHGIFTNHSDEKINEIADEIAVTDTIESEFSTISVADEVSERLRRDE